MDDPRPAMVRSLARPRHDADMERAARARAAPLTKAMTPDDAFRALLLECVAQISANAGAVREGRAVEALHQMRIGLRRLQVVLAIFGKTNISLKALRGRTRALSGRLGPARDLDVFTDELLDAPMRGAGATDAFAALRARAEEARLRAWQQAQGCVASADFAIFMDDIAALTVKNYLPLTLRRQKIKALAAASLDDHFSRARKRARAAGSLEERDLHNLRIALKKLRYAGEFFAPLYKKAKVRAYLRKLKKLQESLGGLNDIAHLRLTLAGLLEETEGRDLCFAAGQVQGWHRERGARLGKNSLRRWKKLKSCDAFWS